jgi:hypothetical protein
MNVVMHLRFWTLRKRSENGHRGLLVLSFLEHDDRQPDSDCYQPGKSWWVSSRVSLLAHQTWHESRWSGLGCIATDVLDP